MTKIGIDGKPIGPQAQSSWLNVYPEGLRGILKWINDRYTNETIYVFENGVSVPNETKMSIADAVHDKFRVDFYKGYIQNAINVVTLDGVNLKGYFGWSLMDNFEWADGYDVRFGMAYVDFDTQKRYMKDSLIWYAQMAKQGQSPDLSVDFKDYELNQR